ncbi:glutathione binding-like protein [Pseudomonas sp. NPDC090202]|uniref:glutathione binding-like protein n=1 Tax=Pseudomonas sp. NPDC090202 TaxID=3364476 RepID=UPI003821478B
MKLFYTPGACSLAPHIVLRELGLPFKLVRVDQSTKTTSEGQDYFSIAPCGYVAALQLADGNVLNEGSTILEYLADLKPEASLAPPAGSWERVKMRERLSFLSCELNSTMNPLWKEVIPDGVKQIFRMRLFKRFDVLDKEVAGSHYQLAGTFSIADAYLFTMLRWPKRLGFSLEPWPALRQFQSRVESRPSVCESLAAELSAQD